MAAFLHRDVRSPRQPRVVGVGARRCPWRWWCVFGGGWPPHPPHHTTALITVCHKGVYEATQMMSDSDPLTADAQDAEIDPYAAEARLRGEPFSEPEGEGEVSA